MNIDDAAIDYLRLTSLRPKKCPYCGKQLHMFYDNGPRAKGFHDEECIVCGYVHYGVKDVW